MSIEENKIVPRKVVITLEDDGNGSIDLNVDFEPAAMPGDPLTGATGLAMEMLRVARGAPDE